MLLKKKPTHICWLRLPPIPFGILLSVWIFKLFATSSIMAFLTTIPTTYIILPGVLVLLTIYTIQYRQCHSFCMAAAQHFEVNMVVPPNHLPQSCRFEVSLVSKAVYISISSPHNYYPFVIVVATTIMNWLKSF